MQVYHSDISCGVGQAFDLWGTTPAQAMEVLADSALSYAIILFSDRAGKRSTGSRLAAALNRKFRGSVKESKSVRNPNTGNKIRVWTLTITPAFRKWAADVR